MILLIVHAVVTWYLVGLIWFVQLAHYPQFAYVGTDAFGEFHQRHTRLTTWAVAPPMLIELLTAAALIALRPAGVPLWAVLLGLGLVGVNGLSTALIQVPMHNKLAGGFDADVARQLVASNWLRTLAWSGRGVLVGVMIWWASRPTAA